MPEPTTPEPDEILLKLNCPVLEAYTPFSMVPATHDRAYRVMLNTLPDRLLARLEQLIAAWELLIELNDGNESPDQTFCRNNADELLKIAGFDDFQRNLFLGSIRDEVNLTGATFTNALLD